MPGGGLYLSDASVWVHLVKDGLPDLRSIGRVHVPVANPHLIEVHPEALAEDGARELPWEVRIDHIGGDDADVVDGLGRAVHAPHGQEALIPQRPSQLSRAYHR